MNRRCHAIVMLSIAVLVLDGCGGSTSDPERTAEHEGKAGTESAAITLAPSAGNSLWSGALKERTFDLPEGFFETDFAQGGDAKKILERDGVEFVEGMEARFDRAAGTLEVKATEGELWVVEAVVDYWGLIEEVEAEARWQRIQKLESRLKDLVIPGVDFKDTPLEEALAYLEETAALDQVPNAKGTVGVKILLDAPRKGKLASGFGFDTPDDPLPMPVTLKLAEVPLFQALRYTTSLAQRKYWIEEAEIRVGYLDSFEEPRLTRAYPAPTDLARRIAEQSDEPAVPDPFALKFESERPFVPTLKSLLENAGITFPLEADAAFDQRRGLVFVRNTSDQQYLSETFLQSLVAESESDAWRGSLETRWNQRADSIVLPLLTFEQSTLIRVVDSIQLHSRLADREGPVWERGLPIWFNRFYDIHRPDEKPADYIAYDTMITVDVSHLTIRQALTRIGEEIGAKVMIEPEGVKFYPIR
jgi:hypothetical protein